MTALCALLAAGCYSPDWLEKVEPLEPSGGAGRPSAGGASTGGSGGGTAPHAGGSVPTGGDGGDMQAPLEDARADAGESDAADADGGRDAGVAETDPVTPALVIDPCQNNDFQVLPCPLPAPCLGEPYQLQMRAGEPENLAAYYDWNAREVPPGLTFSGEEQLLSGTVTGPGSFELELTRRDNGDSRLLRFDFAPRSSCWLAYVSTETGVPLLHLADPHLVTYLQSHHRRTLPGDLLEGEEVVDFAFSPDGALLSVRVRGTDGRLRLESFAAPDWQRIAADLPGSALFHSWSPDGSVLAVVTRDDAGTSLTGLRIARFAAATRGGSPGISVTPLAPVPAPVDSELVWFSDADVAFHAPSSDADPLHRHVHHSALQASGFSASVPFRQSLYSTVPEASFRLEAGDNGFFAIHRLDGALPLVDFYTPAAAPRTLRVVRHHSDAVLDPTGRYTARVDGAGLLHVYRAGESAVDPSAPTFPRPLATSTESCGRLLAWSPHGDQIACVTDGNAGGRVYLFKLEEDPPLSSSTPVDGTYPYSELAASGQRRAFSPSGDWFAFEAEDRLYLADASGDRPVVAVRGASRVQFPTPFAELAFSPNDAHLLQYHSDRLMHYKLVTREAPSQLNFEDLPVPSPCLEHEGPERSSWCGATGARASDVVWALDSRAAAYKAATGALRVAIPQPLDDLTVAPGCDGDCIRSFAFQP